MFEHNNWVNRYREQLSPKGNPFYKQLGIMEATQDVKATAGTSSDIKTQADKNAAEPVGEPVPPAAPTPPTPQKPIDANKNIKEQAIAPAQPGDARVQRIFEYCHKVMLAKDNSFDAYMNSAIKNFNADDIDNMLRVRKEEKSSAFDRAFASKIKEIEESRRDKLRKDNPEITDRQIRLRIDELKKDIEDEAMTAAKAATTNRNDQTTSARSSEGQPISQGLGIFGKSAESIRLAKAVMIRIYSFEILSTILGNATSLGQANKYIQKTMQDIVDEAKQKIAEHKDEEEAPKEEKKDPGEEAIKNPATNPVTGKTLKLEDVMRNFDIDESYLEDEYVKIKIDDYVVTIEAELVKDTLRTVGNLFSKMGSGQPSSMVKFASQDKKKIIGSMIKWFFTKQSFSTRVFGGTNAMAVVDGLTQGYLHAISGGAYRSIKDYFMLNIPQNLKALSEEEFEKTLAKNAGKFQLNQGFVNEMMTSILEAFIARERL